MPPRACLEFDAFQREAIEKAFWTKPDRAGVHVSYDVYCALGLCGDAGKLADKVKKIYRGEPAKDTDQADIVGLLGDVLWYAAVLALLWDVSLSEVAEVSLSKQPKFLLAGKD